MASHLSYLLLVSSIALSSTFVGGNQQTPSTNVSLDSSLHPTTPPTSWHSPSGQFAFGFYQEGSGFSVGAWLITTPGSITVIWNAFRDDPPFPENTTLKLTPQGLKLIVATTSEDRLVSANISDAVAYASMQDSGNFAVYSSGSVPLWKTFDHPTDTIASGQALSNGNQLISSISETNHSQGQFRLTMQSDGNLVMYQVDSTDTGSDAYWATYTNGQDFSTLNLDSDGRLFLLSSNGSASWNLTTPLSTNSTLVYLARLDADGFFRLYSYKPEVQALNVEYKFPLNPDGCKNKGFCGVNSYCISAVVKLECLCLPGFVPLDQQQTSSGCWSNFTDSIGCPLAGGRGSNITMQPLGNTVWPDYSYQTLPYADNKEKCRDACLADCNCKGVFFSGTTCTKQKFPMKYGRIDTDQNSTIVYIKVITGGSLPAAQGGPAFLAPAWIKKGKSSSTTEILIIVTAALTIGLSICLIAFGFLVYKYRAVRYQKLSAGNRKVGLVKELALRSFSYQELLEATEGFNEKLGNGSFGTVFKGALVSPGVNIVVAVKRLEKAAVEEGEREFQAEMRAIGRTHHRNLVRLIGFCNEGSNRLLVYEFMSNGSLADLIFKPLDTEAARPEWSKRVRITLDVARGIHYLHEECEPCIIHCDIKPHNILMDDNWTPKIADFGMAKLLLLNQTRTFTQVRGTRGYLAPEWHRNAPITAKADIYSFGVVLLEIICCNRNLDVVARASEEILLLEWVYSCYVNEELAKLVQDEEVDTRELERFVKVGIWCIQNDPALRPDMKKVLMMLEGNIQVFVPPQPSSVR